METGQPSSALPSTVPVTPIGPILGMLLLMWSASVYSAFGFSAFPRAEWLLEALVAIIFLIPVVNFLRKPGALGASVRIIGLMLLLHSVWDALHWPGHALIDTPIDP